MLGLIFYGGHGFERAEDLSELSLRALSKIRAKRGILLSDLEVKSNLIQQIRNLTPQS